jgi:tetratricopeptide (TPR) repeat protein
MATDTAGPAVASPEGGPVAATSGRAPSFSRESRAVLLIPLDSRISRALVLALVLVGGAALARAIVAPALAEYLAPRAAPIERLERAVAWDPGSPDLHLRLARAQMARLDPGDGDEARAHVRIALRLRPTHGGTWLQLAQILDGDGEAAQAREALATALRLDRHDVVLRWEAALLALHWGERAAALEHLRYVLAVDPGQRDAAFQLARALVPAGEALSGLLPEGAEPLTGILAVAVQHRDLPLAEAAWEQRAPLTPALPAALQRAYLELLLQEGRGRDARRLWLALVPSGRPGAPGDAVWNGGFESESLLGWGLDWQVRRSWGVEIGLDRFVAAQGRQSLRLAFNSFPTLDFSGVSELVPVEPGREYQLRVLVKALDFTTRSGLKLQVVMADEQAEVLAETPTVTGTTADWVPLATRVRVPEAVTLVRVQLRREKAPGPEGNLAGKVWVDDVSLTPIGSGSPLVSSTPSSGAPSTSAPASRSGEPRGEKGPA